jgi:DNA-directed RNA polymerase specialized sigma24 family protein
MRHVPDVSERPHQLCVDTVLRERRLVSVSVLGDSQDVSRSCQIVETVGRLPEPQRLVMVLVGAERLSCAEAAEALDVPVDTVIECVSHARQSIGGCFLELELAEPSTIRRYGAER